MFCKTRSSLKNALKACRVVALGSSPNLVKVVDCGVGKVFGPLLDHHHNSLPNLPVSEGCFQRDYLIDLIKGTRSEKKTSLVSMVKFIKNPDQQSTDPLYRMPERTTIVRNLKDLHVSLFETEETSIVTASEDREEVSDTSMTSRLSLLLDQSKI